MPSMFFSRVTLSALYLPCCCKSQNTPVDELEKERSKVKVTEKDEAIIALENRLVEEQAKSKRLEGKLAPFVAAAASLGRD